MRFNRALGLNAIGGACTRRAKWTLTMDPSIGQELCHLMGFAILEWSAPGEFHPFGKLPPWWSLLDEESAAGDAPFRTDKGFPFLENFLVDANELWDNPVADRLGSGIWQYQSQHGTDLMLEAFAIRTDSKKILLIHNVTQSGTALEYLQQGRRGQLELLRDLGRRRQLELELRTGQEQAERLDQAKTEFVGHVSHEMRTPLTTILGMSELLAQSDLDEEQRANLQTLENSAMDLLTVVKDLLDVARIEAGKITTRGKHFSPVTLVRRVEKDYRPAASERGIELHLQVSNSLPEEVYSDADRLRQILNNLVDNAIKFTDRGKVTLAVEFVQNESEPMLRFQVTDTGVGIERNQQDMIFGAFAQSETTLGRNQSGVGLGLSIARRLAEAIRAEISVNSTPGVGSVFTLTMPTLPENDAPPAPQNILQTHPPAKGPSETKEVVGLRVLVAEDNPVNRKFILNVLSKAGHQSVGVANGQEAVDAVIDNEFDVVLMDCQMPVLNGIQATLAIRERETASGEHLPIVAITAHAMTENQEACIKAGMDFFVTKPFKSQELLATVQKAVAKGK